MFYSMQSLLFPLLFYITIDTGGFNFIQWIVIMLKLSQVWPVVVPSSWLLCHFNNFPYFLSTAILSVSDTSCIFPAPGLEAALFIRSSNSLLWQMVFRDKFWELGVRLLLIVIQSSQWTEQGKWGCVWIIYIYTHTNSYLYFSGKFL